MNNRSRKLLDLAHKLQLCTNCDRFTEGCEPAHQNGIAAGKGQSIKSGDNRHAALCNACHRFYDSGACGLDPSGRYEPTREDKQAMWTQAHMKTMDLYWSHGWIKVAA